MERTMRFNTEFLRLVQAHAYKRDGEASRIFAALIDYRVANRLDDKFGHFNPLCCSDDTLEQEIEKLATVFEAIRSRASDDDKRQMIELLKEEYSSKDVDEIVEEYFPELHLAAGRVPPT
jgi:hypothetical protein